MSSQKPSPVADPPDQAEETAAYERPVYKYIAQRPLKVGVTKDGQPVYRQYGDEVPEVETWKGIVVQRYVQEGHLVQVAVVPRGRGRPRKDEG